MTTQLRDYQKNAIEKIRQHFQETTGNTTFSHGKESNTFSYESRRRVILQLATGSGKTATFCDFLKSCHAKKTPAMMVVKGKDLVRQASVRLTREGVDHGIYQGGNTFTTDEHFIHVCSIDTLYRRKITPPAALLIIDEAHLTNGASYEWLCSHEQYKNSFFLGVTATPFSKTGLKHIGSSVIYPITINELISQGYLVGGKYRVPHEPDLAGVKKSGDDYNQKQLYDRMTTVDEKRKLVGSLTDEWLANCQSKKCILYAVNLQHAHHLNRALHDVGARVEHIDGDTTDSERKDIIARLESREVDVITSVGVLTTGVDIPSLDCLLICRPTASYNLHVQILGRGTRPYPGKTHFDVIDFAGNVKRFGPIEGEFPGTVEETREKRDAPDLATCPFCYAAMSMKQRVKCHGCRSWYCPYCWNVMKLIDVTNQADRGIIEEDGVLSEYGIEEWEIEVPKIIAQAQQRKYKKGWIYHTLKQRYGKQVANQAWKRVARIRKWETKAPREPTQP